MLTVIGCQESQANDALAASLKRVCIFMYNDSQLENSVLLPAPLKPVGQT